MSPFLSPFLLVLLDQLPPAEFDYLPVRPHLVVIIPADEVYPLCKVEFEFGYKVFGCYNQEKRTIYVADDLTPTERELVLRHERAHVNGWRHR